MLQINETWEEFSAGCMLRYGTERPVCSHKDRTVENCLEKKYCPRVVHKEKKEKVVPDWKRDKAVYLKDLNDAVSDMLQDPHFIVDLEKEFPGRDVEKEIVEIQKFWQTDKGYGKKVAAKTETNDWRATIHNGFKLGFNKQWKKKTSELSEMRAW